MNSWKDTRSRTSMMIEAALFASMLSPGDLLQSVCEVDGRGTTFQTSCMLLIGGRTLRDTCRFMFMGVEAVALALGLEHAHLFNALMQDDIDASHGRASDASNPDSVEQWQKDYVDEIRANRTPPSRCGWFYQDHIADPYGDAHPAFISDEIQIDDVKRKAIAMRAARPDLAPKTEPVLSLEELVKSGSATLKPLKAQASTIAELETVLRIEDVLKC